VSLAELPLRQKLSAARGNYKAKQIYECRTEIPSSPANTLLRCSYGAAQSYRLGARLIFQEHGEASGHGSRQLDKNTPLRAAGADHSGQPPVSGGERVESWGIGEVHLSRILLPRPGVVTTLAMPAARVCMVLQERGVSSLEQEGERLCFEPGQWTYLVCEGTGNLRVQPHVEGTLLLLLDVPRTSLRGEPSAVSSEEYLHILRYENHPLLQTVRDFSSARLRLDAASSERIGTLLCGVMECVIAGQQCAQRAAASAHVERLNRVQHYILQHLHDPQLSFEDIARCAGCSKRFVQMMFAETGETVSQFILRSRLERVHCQLLSSSLDITDIAVANGFNDHSHFGRTYRRLFGITPSDARRVHRLAPTRHTG
jgi:AraC-like DNA-binding protein